MTILLKADKSLIITKQSRILQRESAVDKIIFYVPEKYEDIELKDFTATFYYTVVPVNDAMMDILVLEPESDKEGFLKYTFDVDSTVTKFAGTLTGYLTLVKADQAAGKQYVLKSREVSFDILTSDDYYRYVSDASLSAIDDKILQLNNDIQQLRAIEEVYAAGQVDDLKLTEDLLQVSVQGTPIGHGVKVLRTKADDDQHDDGELDLDVVLI